MPRVTAVTVHHRGRDMLGACLESLLATTGVELEVVVVANACDEALPEMATHLASGPRGPLQRSIGFSAANNLGVAWANSHLGVPDYYYFINNDTWSAPDALERLVAAVEAGPGGRGGRSTAAHPVGARPPQQPRPQHDRGRLGLGRGDRHPPGPLRSSAAAARGRWRVTGSALLIRATVLRGSAAGPSSTTTTSRTSTCVSRAGRPAGGDRRAGRGGACTACPRP